MADNVLARDELELLVDTILAAAGPGRVLVCGDGARNVVQMLAMAGIQATHSAGLWDPSAVVGQRFDLVLLWHVCDTMEPDECARLLKQMRPLCTRALAIRTDCKSRPSGPMGEKWIEQEALEAGYRKHPLYLQVCEYERREVDGPDELLLLEPIPDELLLKYPQQAAEGERDLHMDMLRESGRRSDAHVERYRLALQWIRPGDTVLDIACGLGYGSHVLYRGSSAGRVIGVDSSDFAIEYSHANYGVEGRVDFEKGDAERLEGLADASVDVVVSFETLEHVEDPVKLLDQAKRVLRPGGRLVACVPNQWVDETGEDPNPHHHHVYTWERLKGEVSERLVVERAFRQIAGGGMTHMHEPRLLREFDASGDPGDAEWFIVVAMKDPVAGASVPYVETTFPTYDDLEEFHVARFEGEYENPWLAKAMVSIGFRFEQRRGLLDITKRVRQGSAPDSADTGAALCIEGYALLDAGSSGAEERERVRRDIAAYVERAGTHPHQLRWTISNLYVQGLLNLADRRFEAALKSFERCAAMDPRPFSPLLATKTIGAAYYAGLLAALVGAADKARAHWIAGIRGAKAVFEGDWVNVIGDAERPLYFGLPEVAIAVSKASKCAYALNGLDNLRHRPGRFWVEISRDLEAQIARDARLMRHTLTALRSAGTPVERDDTARLIAERQLEHERQRSSDRLAALDRQAVAILEMHRAFEKQAQTIRDLNTQLLARDQALAEQSRTLAKQASAFDAQARNISALQEQLSLRDVALSTQSQTIAGMRRAFDKETRGSEKPTNELARARVELDKKTEALAAQAETIAEMRRNFDDQARNIAELRQQLNARDGSLSKQGDTITEMRRAFDEQAKHLATLNAAVLERDRMLVDKTTAFDVQARNIAALRDQINKGASAFTLQAEAIAEMRRSFEQQAQNIAKLNAGILAREKLLSEQGAQLTTQRGTLQEQAEQLASQRASLDAQSARLASQSASLDEQSRRLASQRASLDAQSGQLAQQAEALEARSREIADLQEKARELAREAAQREAAQGSELERQAQKLAALDAELAESRAANAQQASALHNAAAELAHEREGTRKLEARVRVAEAARVAVDATLRALRESWPYKMLGRWMEPGDKP